MNDEVEREQLAQDVLHALNHPIASTSPDAEFKNVSFSQFHPIMHSFWKCKGWPGGRRRHLAYLWKYRWKDRIRAQTTCRLGRHDPVSWYDRNGNLDRRACRYCWKKESS